jgi:DNA-binding transcriptional MerR regulator
MAAVSSQRPARPLTIGAVCRRLREEFPDISISKIRYLEDQGLLSLRRTHGGYRLFAEEDVERLRTILRLQRDEFLPLRVIREELRSPSRKGKDRRRTGSALRPRAESPLVSFEELCERAGAEPELVRELESYGLVESHAGANGAGFPESDADIASICARLARYGVQPRNLRAIRTAVERESALLEQLAVPALRSRNPERRQTGVEELETLAGLVLELSQLLFWRSLRALVSRP